MFVEWSSTKHIILVQTSQFVWLPWQKVKFAKKIFKNQLLRSYEGVKAETLQNVHSISLYKNKVVFLAHLSSQAHKVSL